jgi:hypothetical protein
MAAFIRRDTRRRLDQFVANPSCAANVLSAVHDVPMDQVAAQVGAFVKFGQSPFAIARGLRFERLLFEDGAARLRAALIHAQVLPAGSEGLLDLRLQRHGGPLPHLEASRARFEELLVRAATADDAGRRALPSLIAAPALVIPGKAILPDGTFAVDVVTLHAAPRPAPIVLRIGEIKVYPDRGGFTDPLELATTRAQAGLYLHALELALRSYGAWPAVQAASDGFLVLTRTGSNHPSVRAGEDLRFQSERADRAFERLRQVAAQTLPLDAPGEKQVPPSRLESVLDAPKAYGEACISFCELADHCHRQAVAEGEPAVLGQAAARLLGPVNLERAAALLHGAPALDAAEEDFLRRANLPRGRA